MNIDGRDQGEGAQVDGPVGEAGVPHLDDAALGDADQTHADADQTHSDADQADATRDDDDADRDQRASDQDQATADRDHAARPSVSASEERAYAVARDERESVSLQRHGTQLKRAGTARDRDATADRRDRTAQGRDEVADLRGEQSRLARLERDRESDPPHDADLLRQLEELSAQAAADRVRAASDRARAAKDRASAARERARLEADLRSAHLDELTGTYRRELGRLALTHEIERTRRSDGRYVLAFVDVDGLKEINDRDGHAAGDLVLQAVVRAIQSRIRSFDPIIRFGGDEFVCGLAGTDLAEAERRFDMIAAAIETDARVGISVGLAVLSERDDVDDLTNRADAAMLAVKARHHSRA